MFTSALRAHKATLNSRIGLTRDSRLIPLARTAVSSWSALNRPKTSRVAVNMPIGRANTHANGINNPAAWATTPSDNWRLTNSGRISFSALPSSSTNVKTITVITSDARIWRTKYACSVFTACPSSAAPTLCAIPNARSASSGYVEIGTLRSSVSLGAFPFGQTQFGAQGRPEAARVHPDRDQVDRHAQTLQPIDDGIRNPEGPAGRCLQVVVNHTDGRERDERARLSRPVGFGAQVVKRSQRPQEGDPLVAQQKENRQHEQGTRVTVLADPVRQIDHRGEGGQIEHLVRHRVGVAAQAGRHLELAGEIAVKQIRHRREDHRCEGHHEPKLRQRIPAEHADRQEQEDERHAYQRQRLDKAELPSQRPARLHETDGFVSYLCRVTTRSGLRCRGKALVLQD